MSHSIDGVSGTSALRDGSVTLPSLFFAGARDTGFYLDDNGIATTVGGVKRRRIDTSVDRVEVPLQAVSGVTLLNDGSPLAPSLNLNNYGGLFTSLNNLGFAVGGDTRFLLTPSTVFMANTLQFLDTQPVLIASPTQPVSIRCSDNFDVQGGFGDSMLNVQPGLLSLGGGVVTKLTRPDALLHVNGLGGVVLFDDDVEVASLTQTAFTPSTTIVATAGVRFGAPSASLLSTYDKGSFNVTLSGPFDPIVVTVGYERIGSIVNLCLPLALASGNNTAAIITSAESIPVSLQPGFPAEMLTRVIDNDTNRVGLLRCVSPTFQLDWRSSVTQAVFAPGVGTYGFGNHYFTYCL